MVEFKTSKCPKCGKLAEIIYSNNPLVPGICDKCIRTSIDCTDLSQADFFCRTYNIPFKPDEWLRLQEKCGDGVFKFYTKQFLETNTENLYYQSTTDDLWGELNEEWQSCITFEQLLSKIEPVKKKFIERNSIKWGLGYSFEEYVQLENLLVSTLRANDISNPLQIDAIKKACKISIELDKAISNGDSKGIKELSTAYASFNKTAQIDNIVEASNNDVITTVADLGDYIERCGGKFKYYDNVDRDIVDKTIHDIQEYNRILVQDATGLSTTLENITQNYRTALEKNAAVQATNDYSIEDIINDQRAGNAEFDQELANETLDDFDLGEEDNDEYF